MLVEGCLDGHHNICGNLTALIFKWYVRILKRIKRLKSNIGHLGSPKRSLIVHKLQTLQKVGFNISIAWLIRQIGV